MTPDKERVLQVRLVYALNYYLLISYVCEFFFFFLFSISDVIWPTNIIDS